MQKRQLFRATFVSCCVLMLATSLIPEITKGSSAPYIKINKNNYKTEVRKVTLTLSGPDGVKEMRVSNEVDFSGAEWEKFRSEKTWYLDYGAGTKTVYVRFKDKNGVISTTIYKDIILLSPPKISITVTINDGDATTDSRYVTVSTTYSNGIDSYRISNDKDFGDERFLPITRATSWILSMDSGLKKVYLQFKNASGEVRTVIKEIKFVQPARYIHEGNLIKGFGSAVYYLGFDGRLHLFLDARIYNSWYQSYDGITQLTDAKLKQYPTGDPICVRQGTWLLKFKSSSRVYAVESGCVLMPIRSEVEAFILYGESWTARVLELDDIYKVSYRILNFDLTNKEKKIADNDRDGLDSEIEEEYGSSDKKADTDRDKLTDYEEIYYWFTDPADKDSDGDGFEDGLELINGYSPTDENRMQAIPAGTYQHFPGTVVRDYNGKYYYIGADGQSHYISNKINSANFTSNNFQAKFVAVPPYKTTIPKTGKSLGKSSSSVKRPQSLNNKNELVDL